MRKNAASGAREAEKWCKRGANGDRAGDRPASQVLRELMRDFIARQQSAREYDDFLRARVALGREQVATGEVSPAAEVEARAAARRAAAGS